jgi:hypothetical protein
MAVGRWAGVIALTSSCLASPLRAQGVSSPDAAVARNLSAVLAAADGTPSPPKSRTGNRLLTFVVIEGFASINSALAAQSPRSYGIAALSLVPISLILERTDHRGILTGRDSALMFGVIGAYNLTLDEDTLSENDIFWRNLVAWQVVVGGIWIGHRMMAPNQIAAPSAWSTAASVTGGGARLSLTRQF